MNTEQFARMRGLEAAYQSSNAGALDIPAIKDQLSSGGALRRVQFETLPEFVDLLENVCNLLGCTRREFLERSMLEAISKAEAEFLAAYREATGEDYGSFVQEG